MTVAQTSDQYIHLIGAIVQISEKLWIFHVHIPVLLIVLDNKLFKTTSRPPHTDVRWQNDTGAQKGVPVCPFVIPDLRAHKFDARHSSMPTDPVGNEERQNGEMKGISRSA